MGFKYFQALGMVIFNKSYFVDIQANTKVNTDKLIKENLELKELIMEVSKTAGNDELSKRIATLQGIVENERALRERAEKDYDKVLEYRKSEINRMETTIKSNNFLIKDLWDMVQIFKRRPSLDLDSCHKSLRDCETKVSQALEVVSEVKPKLQPVNNSAEIIKKEKLTSTLEKSCVDVYA